MDFSFNTIINTIFYLGAIQGVILTFFLFSVRVNKLSNRLLGTLTLIWAVIFLVFALQSYGLFIHYPHLTKIFPYLLLACFPLLYLSIKYLISIHNRFQKADLLHFLPLLFAFILTSRFYFKAAEEKIRINALQQGYYYVVSIITEEMLAIQGIVYTILALLFINNYKRNIVDYQSNINNKVLNGFKTGIVLALIAWAIGIVGAHVEKLNIDLGVDLFLFVYLIFVGIIYLLSILAIRSPEVFKLTENEVIPFGTKREDVTIQPATPNSAREESIPVISNENGHDLEEELKLNKKLTKYMVNEKPYLNPDLSLQNMAEHLNVSRHHLSAVINQLQKMNFNEFVNNYRVNEVKELMGNLKNKNQKNYDLAFAAGFNSKASFYRIFKQLTNQTPSNFRTSLNKNSTTE